MVYIVAFFLTIITPQLIAASDEIRSNAEVVGGRFSNIENHPYIVSIRRFNNHICGGSIYRPNIIITAAHCVRRETPSNLKVVAGLTSLLEVNQVARKVRQYVLHPDYNKDAFDYDVALILLNKTLPYNEQIQPIELAKIRPSTGFAQVAGWGYIHEESRNSFQFQAVPVAIIMPQMCQNFYHQFVIDRMLCAGGHDKDACQDDSGGSLISEGKLLGLVAFGVSCSSGLPGAYTSIPDVSEWINKMVES